MSDDPYSDEPIPQQTKSKPRVKSKPKSQTRVLAVVDEDDDDMAELDHLNDLFVADAKRLGRDDMLDDETGDAFEAWRRDHERKQRNKRYTTREKERKDRTRKDDGE